MADRGRKRDGEQVAARARVAEGLRSAHRWWLYAVNSPNSDAVAGRGGQLKALYENLVPRSSFFCASSIVYLTRGKARQGKARARECGNNPLRAEKRKRVDGGTTTR